MKIRIIFGKELVAKYGGKGSLNNLYSAADCIIEGGQGIDVIEKDGKISAVFCGHLAGKRMGGQEMRSLGKDSPDFNKFISGESIDKCIGDLEGRFILVKISGNSKYEICCDRFGRIDLYYQQLGGGAIFASELGLLPFKDGEVKYDQVGIAHALYIYGYRPAKQHTFYKGVSRLAVSEIATWKNGKLFFRSFAFPVLETNEGYGENEIAKYYNILKDAILKRSSPNGNLIYLSSGWDSSSLLSLLVKLRGAKKVRALTGRLKIAKRSGVINQFEVDRAKKIADYFGIKLEIAEYDFWRRGPELIEQLQPLMRAHMLSSMSVFQWACLSAYVEKTGNGEAVFAGEVSDGSHNLGFGQFTTIFHPVLEFREYSDKMAAYLFGPTFLKSMREKKCKSDQIYNFLKQQYNGAIFDELSNDNNGCTSQLFASFFARDNRIPLWSLKNSKLLTEYGRQAYGNEMGKVYFDNPSRETTLKTLYSWYLHLYNSFHWQGGTVSSLGAVANNYGFEINLPFWDARMQEFLSSMPESWGRGLEIRPTKYPLKRMLKQYVDYPWHLQVGPHSYTYDVKPEFSPIGEFIYASAFTPYIKELFRKRAYEKILSADFFDLKYINGVVNRYLKGEEPVGSDRSALVGLTFVSLPGWY